MNKSTFILILFISFLPFYASAAQPPKPVNVVNTPAVTVPGGVTVNNEDTNPVPVSIVEGGEVVSTRQVYLESLRDTYSTTFNLLSFTFSPVPDGKILVIEMVSCDVAQPQDQALISCNFRTFGSAVDPQAISVSLPVIESPAGESGSTGLFEYTGVFSGRVYVPPNQSPVLSMLRSDSGSSGGVARVSISGYLIDATSPTLSP